MKNNYNNYHSRNFIHALQEFNDLGLVSGLYTGEQPGPGASHLLFGKGEVIKFPTGVGFASCVFIFTEYTDTPADSFSSSLQTHFFKVYL